VLHGYRCFSIVVKWRILCFSKHHASKTYGRVEVGMYAFLTGKLDGGEWAASRFAFFTVIGKVPRYALERRLGVSQTRCGRVCKEKELPTAAGNRTPVIYPIALLLYWLNFRGSIVEKWKGESIVSEYYKCKWCNRLKWEVAHSDHFHCNALGSADFVALLYAFTVNVKFLVWWLGV